MIFIKKKIINLLGTVITLICFIFIIKMVLATNMDWNIINDNKLKWILLIFLSFVLAIGVAIMSYGWSMLVKFIEYKDINNKELMSVYIKSNIAKYLPGNVMNLVGRNVLAGKLGFKQISIATSSILEIVVLGCTIMILVILFSIHKLTYVYQLILNYINYKFINIIMILAGIFLIGLILYAINNRNQNIQEIKKYFNLSSLKLLMKLLGLYSIYFILSGIILAVILKYILNIDIDLKMTFEVIGIYSISFFIGYITPGAPGGMGIREVILILLITNVAGSDLATIASVIHRIITIIADIIIYSINYLKLGINKNSLEK